MKYLVLLKANIRKQKGSLLGIALLMLIITVTLSGVLSIWSNSRDYVTSEMDRVRYGDVIYWVTNVPDLNELIKDIESIDDTDHVDEESIINVSIIINGKESSSRVELSAYDPEVYSYHFFKGKSPKYDRNPADLKAGEVYLPICYVSIYDAKIGDQFYIKSKSGEDDLGYLIKGFYEDPTAGTTMMGIKNALISKEDMDTLLNQESSETLKVQSATRIHVFQSKDSTLSEKKFQCKLSTETDVSKYTNLTYIKSNVVGFMLILQNVFIGFLFSFSVILLIVSVIVIGHSISSCIEQDYVDLGILKATGFTKGDLRLIQSLQYMMALCLGLVLGLSLSHLLLKVINRLIVPVTGILTPDQIPVGVTILCFGGILLTVFLFILWKTNQIGTVTPITAIRGGKEAIYFGSRVRIKIHKKGLNLWLAIRQLITGGKHYLGATIITALLVFFLTICGRILNWLGPDGSGLLNTMGMASVDGKSYDLGVLYPDQEMKEEIEQKILDESPILASYQAVSRTALLDDTEYLLNTISNPEYLHMVKGRYCKYKNEIVITETVARELKLSIGDTVSVRLGENKADYIITGLNQCANDLGDNFAMSFEGFAQIDDGVKKPYWNYVMKDNAKKKELCEQLRKDYGTKISVDENTWSGSDGIVVAAGALEYLLDGISILLIMIVVYMTGSKILYQEQHDLGVYKSLGFQSSCLRTSFALRFVLISSVGSIFGVLLSLFLTDPIVGKMFSFFGVSNFSSVLGIDNLLKATLVVILLFFAFAYLSSGKIKKTDPGILIVE